MASEALRNIRTMRQVKISLDVARNQKTKTTNSLSKTEEELKGSASVDGRRTGQILAKERARSAAYSASLDKSRQRLLRSREKLAAIINQNRALTQLRHELQQARWQGEDPTRPSTTPIKRETSKHAGFGGMELKY